MTKVYCEILNKDCILKSEKDCKKCIKQNVPEYFEIWRK